jgi:hypothetical protein
MWPILGARLTVESAKKLKLIMLFGTFVEGAGGGRGLRWAGVSCLPSTAARNSMTPSFPVRRTTVTSKKPPEMHTNCSGNTNVTPAYTAS